MSLQIGKFSRMILVMSLLAATATLGLATDAPSSPTSTSKPDVSATKPVTGLATTLSKARLLVPEDGPLQVRWALDLKDRTVNRFFLPPAELEYEYFLVETKENDLLAIDRRSGKTLWWTHLEAPILDQPAFSAYATYLICSDFLISLERYSGEPIWRLNLTIAPRFGPSVYESIKGKPQIYIPGIDRIVYCYAPKKYVWPPVEGTGSITRDDIVMERYSLNLLWQTKTYGLFSGPLAQKSRFLMLSDDQGMVVGISTANISGALADETWSFKARKAISGGPLTVGPAVYAASRDSYLYCLSRREGGILWKYQTGEILKRSPEVVLDPLQNKTCLLLWAKEDMLALDDTNGSLLWKKRNVETVVARMTDPEEEMSKRTSIITRGIDGTLRGSYLSTGVEHWSIPGASFEVVCPNTQMEFILASFANRSCICALEENR